MLLSTVPRRALPQFLKSSLQWLPAQTVSFEGLGWGRGCHRRPPMSSILNSKPTVLFHSRAVKAYAHDRVSAHLCDLCGEFILLTHRPSCPNSHAASSQVAPYYLCTHFMLRSNPKVYDEVKRESARGSWNVLQDVLHGESIYCLSNNNKSDYKDSHWVCTCATHRLLVLLAHHSHVWKNLDSRQ